MPVRDADRFRRTRIRFSWLDAASTGELLAFPIFLLKFAAVYNNAIYEDVPANGTAIGAATAICCGAARFGCNLVLFCGQVHGRGRANFGYPQTHEEDAECAVRAGWS